MSLKVALSAPIVSIGLILTSTPANTATPTDACQVLSAAQVSAALGATVEEGTHVTPTFTKTCTWIVKDGGIIVTLNIQAMAMFQAGKGTLAGKEVTSASGVGDESYYIGVGSTVGLEIKKGDSAFKVSVYSSKHSLEQRKAIEKTLAQQAASKF